MTSVAESSVNSVPVAQLAQLRDALLQQEPEASTVTSHPSLIGIDSEPSQTDDASRQAAVTVPESVDIDATTQPFPQAQHTPRMNVSKSATAVEMEMVVNPSPSQEAFAPMTRPSSFHGYPGGDTQPMESQVYRDFNASARKPRMSTPVRRITLLDTQDETDTYNTHGTQATPHTFVEGDTGFVDVVNGMTSPYGDGMGVEDNFEPTQLDDVPQLQRCLFMPETPAIAGHKHGRDGEILTSVNTAPRALGLSQLFGGKQDRPILSATQAFNQTQAPSSPVQEGPRSDPVVTRPSPHLDNLSLSSPVLRLVSSPIEYMKPPFPGEPRDHYTRMCESQERRATARFKAELDNARDVDDDLLEDEPDEMDDMVRRAHRQRLQRAKSAQAVSDLSKFGAPSRPGSRHTPRPKTASLIDLTTPALRKENGLRDVTAADDANSSQGDVLPEDEAIEHSDLNNDEYDELGQTVIRSQEPDPLDVLTDLATNQISPEKEGSEVAKVDHAAGLRPADVDAAGLVSNDQPKTQHSTVADSQPQWTESSNLIAHDGTQLPSSNQLFVPGSQYAAKTTHDHAKLAMQSWTLSSQHRSNATSSKEQRVPSSPPLQAASIVHRDAQRFFEARSVEEIPESDVVVAMSDNRASNSSRPASAHGRIEVESNNPAVFSTAPTHFSQPEVLSRRPNSQRSFVRPVPSQLSQTCSESPITAANIQRFADIASMQSPAASDDSQVNLDAIMGDIMTADDEQFLQIVSSPTEDRPLPQHRPLRSSINADNGGQRAVTPASGPALVVEVRGHDAGSIVAEEIERDAHTPPKPLRESPSKANERPVNSEFRLADAGHKTACKMPALPPTRLSRRRSATAVQADKEVDAEAMASETVRIREVAGAKTASQLISKRSSRPQKVYAKRAHREKATNFKLTEQERPESNERDPAIVDKGLNNGDATEVEDRPAAASDGKNDQARPIVAPYRIFTLFKGTHNNFYTATWLHPLPDGMSHRVQFDDGTQTTIELQHIRSLELRIGDQVKINMDGMRGKVWSVRGFEVPAEKNTSETDIYGCPSLQVQAKSSRSSVASSIAAGDGDGDLVTVAMSDVYLTHTMWPHFAERTFRPPSAVASIASRAGTPSSTAQTAVADSPNSRARRSLLAGAKGISGRISYARDEAAAGADGPASIGLFMGMAFAVSYSSNEKEKNEVLGVIKGQGGVILEKGFDELFDVPSALDTSVTSPGKKSPEQDRTTSPETAGLQLRTRFQGSRFVALIADRHSRRVKYMQALALGIPTLSGRWILDSLDPIRNASLSDTQATPLPWSKYLLPAGESVYLGGAIRSRTLSDYPAHNANLSEILERRSLLLKGGGVLIIGPKSGKDPGERFKTYTFLTLALGADTVRRVNDLKEAKAWTMEAPDTWKWIYVDGSVAEASSILLNKGGAGGKKRKRDEDLASKMKTNAMSAGHDGVAIVNNEFVLQSLILGALVDIGT